MLVSLGLLLFSLSISQISNWTDYYGVCEKSTLPQIITDAIPVIPLNEANLIPNFLRHIVNLACLRPQRWQQRCNELLSVTLGEIDDAWLISEQQEQHENLPSPILRALVLIDKHAHEDISIEQIAQEVGWTHEHFSRVFIKYLGISPQQKLNEKRIEKACQLLVQTQETVKESNYSGQ